MRQADAKRRTKNLILFFAPTLFLALFFLICSFTVAKFGDDFLKQLGITKQSADEKITNSIIGGYIDSYGAKSAKNIALGNRKAVTLDMLSYIKNYVSSAAFVKQYNQMRDSYKPKEQIAQTPETMQAEEIAMRKKSVADLEVSVKTADASIKKIFENALVDAKKALKEAEDPNNKYLVAYKKNYPDMVKSFKDGYDRNIADWNVKYPQNQLLFVKKRLQEFLEVTKDVDFSAKLEERNGKKYFVNPDYEHKDSRWKMAFRAGKDVTETSRAFAQQWISEIK